MALLELAPASAGTQSVSFHSSTGHCALARLVIPAPLAPYEDAALLHRIHRRALQVAGDKLHLARLVILGALLAGDDL